MTQRDRRRMIVLLVCLAAGIAVVDQATKYLAEERLTQGVVVPLVGEFLGWQLIYNPGAAFSLATGMTWVFTVITLIVIVIAVRVARRLQSTAWAVALGMLLGGALGNLYDRLFREPGFARGHVVDFINYNGWFVGNVADIAIVVAAVLIALLALLGIEVDGTRAQDDENEDEDEDAAAPEIDEDVSEEPLADDADFSAEVPRASGDGVDVASWVEGARSPSGGRGDAVVEDDDAARADEPAEPAGEAVQVPAREPAEPAPAAVPGEPGGESGTPAPAAEPAEPAPADSAESTPTAAPLAQGPAAEPAEPAAGTAEPDRPAAARRPRPRSRREARLAAEDDG